LLTRRAGGMFAGPRVGLPAPPSFSRQLLPFLALALPWVVWANHATDGEFVRVFFWPPKTYARFGRNFADPSLFRIRGGLRSGGSPPTSWPWTPAFASFTIWGRRSGGFGVKIHFFCG